jgi:hypothetical protein
MTFAIFADYFQFYLRDEKANVDFSNSWNEDTTLYKIALVYGAVAVGTARNMTVPVEVEIVSDRPLYSLDEWDMINECGISITRRNLIIAGCTEYLPDAKRLNVIPGDYCVLVFYKNLSKLSEDELDGEDSYKLILWPVRKPVALRYIT